MNQSVIRYLIGKVLTIEAVLLLLPAVVGLFYSEYHTSLIYVCVAAFSAAAGILLGFKKPTSRTFYLKEGCIVTSLSWIVLSLIGAIPFTASGEIPSYLDAVFETVSGFSTTGASILTDVTALCHANLFWRSFTNWIGGMGVLVFLLAVVSMNGGSSINLMRAESPGPSVGKLVPKVAHTARLLYILYFALSFLMLIILLIGRMPLFDAACATFSTAGTGGFAIYNDSMGSLSHFCKWTIATFMFMFGTNFNFFYYLVLRDPRKAFSMEEVRAYLGMVIASTALIYLNLRDTAETKIDALLDSFFQVASIISTTGFSTTDYDQWKMFPIIILVVLMVTGACAGSTAGGIKVSRIILLIKTIRKEIGSYIHPKSIKKIQMDGKPVEHEVVRSVNVFIMTYICILILSSIIISIGGYDFATVFSSAATTLSNVGPGLSQVGPAQNYAFMDPISKVVLIFNMLAGRLELFPVLILLHPRVWKELFQSLFRRLSKKQKTV